MPNNLRCNFGVITQQTTTKNNSLLNVYYTIYRRHQSAILIYGEL